MTNATEALLSIARPASLAAHGRATPVVAIIRLCTSRRSWFVTSVQRREYAIKIVGYAPGRVHSSGHWFSLEPDFFEVAAAAIGDQLDIEILKKPIPLEAIEDESLLPNMTSRRRTSRVPIA